jgi:hypothetical protein
VNVPPGIGSISNVTAVPGMVSTYGFIDRAGSSGWRGGAEPAIGLVPAAMAQRVARPIAGEERITCGQLQEIPGSKRWQETAGSIPAPPDLPHAPLERPTRPRLQPLKDSTFSGTTEIIYANMIFQPVDISQTVADRNGCPVLRAPIIKNEL